ncbi:MAG: RNA 2',3'-cyclic phosphodiesterase [Candidatus Latescibacterota bacterium]|jgi:2'-5' RNA ligase
MRAFVGMRLPDAVAQELGAWAAELLHRWPANAVHWVPSTHMHITLRFLGDSEASALAAYENALAALGRRSVPFELRLTELGAFPNARKPRVLWLGLDGDMDELVSLAAARRRGRAGAGLAS